VKYTNSANWHMNIRQKACTILVFHLLSRNTLGEYCLPYQLVAIVDSYNNHYSQK